MPADSGHVIIKADQACTWCKVRKKKCDKVLPTCGYCERKGLECGHGHHASAPLSSPSKNGHSPYATTSSSSVFGRRTPGPGWSPSGTWVETRTPLTAITPTPISPEAAAILPLPIEIAAFGVITTQSNVYHHVLRIIRGTGQFVDDITARYFQSVHRYLPVISRSRFHRSLVTLGSVPGADFSALLLGICLVTFVPPSELEHPSGTGSSSSSRLAVVNRQALHLATRSVLAQVQALMSTSTPSVHLIQAWLLLALYEYAHGQPDDAFQTVAVCARMAYRARIHTRLPAAQLHTVDRTVLLEIEEAASTWWGIVIFERNIFCDVSTREQPLVSRAPGKDSRLPLEPENLVQSEFLTPDSVPDIPVSCLTSANIGGFGRLAQAACLLDQVLQAIVDPTTTHVSSSPSNSTPEDDNVDALLVRLDGLDASLQNLLATVMQVPVPSTFACSSSSSSSFSSSSSSPSDTVVVFCSAIACAIRALYLLHAHILSLPPSLSVGVSAKFRPLAEWFRLSRAALRTLAGMVVEIAEAETRGGAGGGLLPARQTPDVKPPSFAYCIRATLAYLRGVGDGDEDDAGRMRDAEQRLERAWSWYEERWGSGKP